MNRALPLLVALLVGCGHPEWRAGNDLAVAGDQFAAMGVWLDAVEAAEASEEGVADPKVVKAVGVHAEDAWIEQLDVAHDHEAARRLADARRAFLDLLAYAARLSRHDLLRWDTDGARAELAKVEDDLAAQHVRTGAKAAGEDDWAGAVVAYERAFALRPKLDGLAEKRAAALRGWADADLAQGRYRDAVNHYDAAYVLIGAERDREWSRAVHLALGRDFLRQRACRQAAVELVAAQRDRVDPEVSAPLADARACARVELVAPPFDIAPADIDDRALAVTITEHMEAALLASKSEHLVLLDASAAGRFSGGVGGEVVLGSDSLKSSRHLGAKAADATPVFLVRGRINAVKRGEATKVSKGDATARRTVDCKYEGAREDRDGRCSVDTTVRFDDHRLTRTVTVSGSVRLLDGLTGETVFLDTVDAEESAEARWVDGLEWPGLTGEWRTAEVATRPDRDVLAVPQALFADVGSKPTSLSSWEELGERAMKAFAVKVAARVLSNADRGVTVDDPTRLEITRPLIDPSDIQLGTIEPAVRSPEEIEFAPPSPMPQPE